MIEINAAPTSRWPRFRATLRRTNPFFVDRYVLWSPLTPEECFDRLQHTVYPLSYAISMYLDLLRDLPENPVYGWIKPDHFSIRDYRRTYLHHAWKRADSTVANGRLVPVADGTRIDLSLGMSRTAKVYAVLWMLLVILGLGSGLAQGGIMLVLMTIFVLSLVGWFTYGRRCAIVRQEFLIQFLKEELEAFPASESDSRDQWLPPEHRWDLLCRY